MRTLIVLLFCFWAGIANATIAAYQFSNAHNEARFLNLTQQLRCPKCQNENIHNSDAPIAADMRQRVYEMIEHGDSDRQIKNALVKRFGEYVLYKPRVEKRTLILWFGPAIAALLGLVIVAVVVSRQSRAAGKTEGQNSLSDEERARLKALLDEDAERH